MLLPNLFQVTESISGSVVPLAMFLQSITFKRDENTLIADTFFSNRYILTYLLFSTLVLNVWKSGKSWNLKCAIVLSSVTQSRVLHVLQGEGLKGWFCQIYSSPYDPLYFSRHIRFERVFHLFISPQSPFPFYIHFYHLAKDDLFKNPQAN